MNVMEIFDNPAIFLVGLLWMAIHVALMVGVAKIIRAPFFFLAVGSKANIGGAASAPIIAAAFHPSLAPVGVILAVLGYALGTYWRIYLWIVDAGRGSLKDHVAHNENDHCIACECTSSVEYCTRSVNIVEQQRHR